MALGSHTEKALKRIAEIKDDKLDLSWLNIRSVPPLSPTLKSLNCSYSNIDTLPELPETLESLDCSYTKLKSLPPLPDKLASLECKNCRNLAIQKKPEETIAEYKQRWVNWHKNGSL
jgi:Leucine-rich repeat (LRR) protein